MKQLSLLLLIFFTFLPITAAPDKTVKIHEIKQEKGKRGEYQTEGYVVNSYTCPPCPPRAECKPCMMPTHIVISEEKNLPGGDQLTEKELIVFTTDATPFEKDKKYLFSIKVTDRKTTREPLNDIELIGYKASK